MLNKPYVKPVLICISGLFILYTLIGFFLVPVIVKKKIRSAAPEGVAVDIETLRFNPYTLVAGVDGMAVSLDKEPLVSLSRCDINFSIASLFKLALVVEGVHVKAPKLWVSRNKQGKINLLGLMPETTGKTAPRKNETPLFPFWVSQVLLENGSAELKDDLTGEVFHIQDLNFSLPLLSSLEKDQQTDTVAQLGFTLNQAPISLHLEGRPFIPERPAKARLHIETLKLDPFWAYPKIPEGVIPESRGTLACDLAFHYAHDSDQKAAGHRIGLNGKARIEKIGIDLVDQGPLARVPGLEIELDTKDLLSQGLKVSRILVDHPEFSIQRDSSGRLVLLNVLGPQGGTENSTDPGSGKDLPEKGGKAETQDTEKTLQPGLTLLVDEARIESGKLRFSDASVNDGFKSELSKISIGIKDFRMDPSVSSDVQGEITTGSDEQIQFKAQVRDKEGLSINGEVMLKNGSPMNYAPYLGEALRNAFHLDRVNAAAGFSLVLNQGRVSGQVSNGKIGLTGIRVFDLDGKQTIIGIPDIQIKGIGLDLDKQLLTVDAAESANGEISILRSADGSVNLAQRIESLTDLAGPGGSKEPAPPWHFLVKQVKAGGWSVNMTDHGRQPVSINLSDIRIEASNLTSTPNETGKLLADLTWQKNGRIRIKGDLDLVKPKADLNFELAGLDIGTFQPYFTDYLNIDITDGQLQSSGSLSIAPGKEGTIAAGFKGKTMVSEFKSRNKATGNDFFKCKSLYLTGMDVSVFPIKVDITEISLTDFYSRVVLLADGSLNFKQVLVRDKEGSEGAASAQESPDQYDENKETMPRFNVQAITLQGGHINFTDYFTKPNFKANMTEIAGSIQNLSSVSEEPAQILLKGVHGLNSPLDINGTLKPFGQRSADIDLSFKNIELTEFNAYSAKYLGYEIEKGKLMVDLKYKIAGNELESSNRFFLDQFTLGNRVESKDATSLPVALAVSLLKNPEDEIDLDIPIKGNLDDPDFDFSGVVFETVKNLILGVVAAPFKFMGKLFADGAEELGYVTFAPASHTLDAENKGKLDRLMDILEKKTGLELAIRGAWDPGLDAEGIRKQSYESLLLSVAGASDATPAKQEAILSEDREKLVEKAYEAALFTKPRDEKGKEKEISLEDKEKLLITHIEVGEAELQQIAALRGQMIMDYMADSGRVAPERIFILSAAPVQEDETLEGAVKVLFELK